MTGGPGALAGHFDDLADRYDASVEHRVGRTFARLRRALDGVGLVVDVGCGPGHLLAVLGGDGHPTIGIDLSPAMLAVARGRAGEAALLRADAVHIPLATGVAGGVTLRFVAQHLEDLDAALGEVARVLGPGGVLAVSDTVAPDEPVARRWQHHLEVDRDPHHQKLLTAGDWRARLDRSGFDVVAIDRVPYPQTFDAWADRVAMPEAGRARAAAALAAAPPEAVAAFAIAADPAGPTWRWEQATIVGTLR